jgi:hypothetical protein
LVPAIKVSRSSFAKLPVTEIIISRNIGIGPSELNHDS